MSYENASIKRDADNNPVPQIFNEQTGEFEVLKGSGVYTIFGNSTESKPMDVDKGVSFFEIDTGTVEMFDGTEWVGI